MHLFLFVIYLKESKLEGKIEGEIKATIKIAKSFGASDSVIIKTLMDNCNLTEDEAKLKLGLKVKLKDSPKPYYYITWKSLLLLKT